MISLNDIDQAKKEFGSEFYKCFAWKLFSDGTLVPFYSADEFYSFYQETLGESIIFKKVEAN